MAGLAGSSTPPVVFADKWISHMNTTKSKRRLAFRPSFWFGLFLLACMLSYVGWRYGKSLPFDSSAWKTSGPATRGRMVKDSEFAERFLGLSEADLMNLLGSPYYVSRRSDPTGCSCVYSVRLPFDLSESKIVFRIGDQYVYDVVMNTPLGSGVSLLENESAIMDRE